MHTTIKIAVVSVLALFAIVGVMSISKAEVINLELKCDGKIDLIFRTFERQNIWDSLMTGVDNKDFLHHSQRISITNNKLNGIFELQVDEKLIYLNERGVKQINNQIEENISNELWLGISDYDFYVDIKFELDRYTGNLTAEFELDSNEVIYYILNEFLYEGLEELLPDISGFSFNAECKKLEEKLF